jgi:hypothetical protein
MLKYREEWTPSRMAHLYLLMVVWVVLQVLWLANPSVSWWSSCGQWRLFVLRLLLLVSSSWLVLSMLEMQVTLYICLGSFGCRFIRLRRQQTNDISSFLSAHCPRPTPFSVTTDLQILMQTAYNKRYFWRHASQCILIACPDPKELHTTSVRYTNIC